MAETRWGPAVGHLRADRLRRVLFSTYQTSGSLSHISRHPQERVLLYLIMEIGACIETVPPVD